MGAKSWIFILGIGVAAVIAMGLMTTYLVDQRPDLQAVIEFKTAFAEEFKDEQFEEVSLRRLPKRRGYQLSISRKRKTSSEELDRRIAEYFAEKFDQRVSGALCLSYSPPRGFGCNHPEPYHEKEISLRELRVEMANRAKEGEIRTRLREALSLELQSFRRERGELTLGVRPAKEAGSSASETGDPLLELAIEVRRVVSEILRYRQLIVRIAPAPETEGAPSGAGEESDARPRSREVVFDSRGRILRSE